MNMLFDFAAIAAGLSTVTFIFGWRKEKERRPLHPRGVRPRTVQERQPALFLYTYVASTALVPNKGSLKPAKAQKAAVLCIYIQSTRSAPHDRPFTFMAFRP